MCNHWHALRYLGSIWGLSGVYAGVIGVGRGTLVWLKMKELGLRRF